MEGIGFMTRINRSDDTIVFENNNQYGLIDNNGNIITRKLYDAISLFEDAVAEVILQNKAGLIKNNGEVLLDCIYDAISNFDNNGLARILIDKKEGLFSSKGFWVIEPCFSCIYPCYDQLYIVCKDGKREDYPSISILYSSSFKMGCEYEDFDFNHQNNIYSTEYSISIYKGKWGVIDMNGVEIIPFLYNEFFPFKDGITVAQKGEKWGALNNRGEIIVPFIHQSVFFFDYIPLYSESSINFQDGNTITEYNSKGEITNIRKQYNIPRLDEGCFQESWKECFQNKDLNIAEHFNFFELMREYNMYI